MLPRADILVRDGRIEAVGPDLAAAGAETIDATDMIVMPGFVDTHYHMWSAVGRNFVGDGFGYFAAKNATSKLFEPADFYNSVMLGLVELANAGVTTVHNWSHNTRTRGACRRRVARAPRSRCCARSIRTATSTRCRATSRSISPASTACSATISPRARRSTGW